jgi:hypothetical protein
VPWCVKEEWNCKLRLVFVCDVLEIWEHLKKKVDLVFMFAYCHRHHRRTFRLLHQSFKEQKLWSLNFIFLYFCKYGLNWFTIIFQIQSATTALQFIHSFHWHVQNATIPCQSQECPPFLSVTYFFLPPFSTNYSSILSHSILPSISLSTSQSCCSQIQL